MDYRIRTDLPDPLKALRVPEGLESHKGPNAGGCWICHGDYDSKPGPMEFDMEFDTYYHQYCADKIGVRDITEFERGEWHE